MYFLSAIKRKINNKSFKEKFLQKSNILKDGRFICDWCDSIPCTDDAKSTTPFDAHYIYHTAWATRRIIKNGLDSHVDISSSLYFVTQLSAFIDVDFYDYRPADINISGLSCNQADLMSLDFKDDSIDSLSCMHVVEHIGLERYGDKFDPRGDLKAIAELKRVTAKHGFLFFVVPVGEMARIQYNAHRIYTYRQIISYFDGFKLDEFSFINDEGVFISCANENDIRGQKYGCGYFCFIKND